MLVVAKSSEITALDSLRGARLGYTHCYCTSSYFAPALLLLLLQNHLALADFHAELVPVPAFQGQSDAVADGRVDATMVQENIWRSKPENREATQITARQDNLPSPLMIVGAHAEPQFKQPLMQFLFSHHPAIDPTTLFSGFVLYERQQIKKFFRASAEALPAP